jgi:hypothetical protein
MVGDEGVDTVGDLEIVALRDGETLRGAVEYGAELVNLLDGV